jgi:hypothetical protein
MVPEHHVETEGPAVLGKEALQPGLTADRSLE